MFYLSQAHLQRFQKCPIEFQHLYLDQLAEPINPEQQQKQEWGVNFHQVMQQLHLGFSLREISNDEKLKFAIRSLIECLPEFLDKETNCHSEAEYRCNLMSGEFLLTIICDWIAFKSDSLEIYDWKTYRKPQKKEYLKHHWQTKLYLYLMAETTDYKPKDISMTYWFIESGTEPQSLRFKYSQAWHKRIAKELKILLASLENNLADYLSKGIGFQHPNNENCFYCSSLGKTQQSLNILDAELSVDKLLDSIEAIEI